MAQGAAECDKQRVPQKETRPETMKSPLVSAQNALILFKSPPFFIVRREKKERRRKTILHSPRWAIYSARKRKLYPTKKPAVCLIHGLFLYANSLCLHRSCNALVLDQALFAQQVGEGFEFCIPFFAETADEGFA